MYLFLFHQFLLKYVQFIWSSFLWWDLSNEVSILLTDASYFDLKFTSINRSQSWSNLLFSANPWTSWGNCHFRWSRLQWESPRSYETRRLVFGAQVWVLCLLRSCGTPSTFGLCRSSASLQTRLAIPCWAWGSWSAVVFSKNVAPWRMWTPSPRTLVKENI